MYAHTQVDRSDAGCDTFLTTTEHDTNPRHCQRHCRTKFTTVTLLFVFFVYAIIMDNRARDAMVT